MYEKPQGEFSFRVRVDPLKQRDEVFVLSHHTAIGNALRDVYDLLCVVEDGEPTLLSREAFMAVLSNWHVDVMFDEEEQKS